MERHSVFQESDWPRRPDPLLGSGNRQWSGKDGEHQCEASSEQRHAADPPTIDVMEGIVQVDAKDGKSFQLCSDPGRLELTGHHPH